MPFANEEHQTVHVHHSAQQRSNVSEVTIGNILESMGTLTWAKWSADKGK